MYQSLIKLKLDLEQELVDKIHNVCNAAFDNHISTLRNKSNDPNILIFEDSNPMGSICHGITSILKSDIVQYFDAWEFVDLLTGNESCSALEFYKIVKPNHQTLDN